jgi:hypothetical protein
MTERFRWLAAVIAAQPNRELVSRIRLQKAVKLLQGIGLPTAYGFTLHFRGPYSEDLDGDIEVLKHLGLISERLDIHDENVSCYVYTARDEAALPEMERFRDAIALLGAAPPVALDLAATYDAYRDAGLRHEQALAKVRVKKRAKWMPEAEVAALELIQKLRSVDTPREGSEMR